MTPMRLKIKGEAVNLAETIGEYRESVEALEAGASVLRKAFMAAKEAYVSARRNTFAKRRGATYRARRRQKWKKVYSSASDVFLDMAAADLAVKFGVVPYLSLANQLAEKLQHAASEGITKKFVVTVPRNSAQVLQILGSDWLFDAKLETSTRAILYVRFKPYSPVWTGGNPLEALWAGTRLSFMVDWFWNFGNYLSALDAMDSVVWVNGVVVTRRFGRALGRYTRGNGYILKQAPRWAYRSYQRQVVQSVPVGLLPEFIIPEQRTGQLLSAMEILATLRGSSAKPI